MEVTAEDAMLEDVTGGFKNANAKRKKGIMVHCISHNYKIGNKWFLGRRVRAQPGTLNAAIFVHERFYATCPNFSMLRGTGCEVYSQNLVRSITIYR